MIEAGATEQVDSAGAPMQLKDTALLNPELGVMVSVKLAEVPAKTLADVGEPEIVKSAPLPEVVVLPDRFTIWGLLGALSATVTDAFRVPAAVGAKVTDIVHCVPGARVEPHVLVALKSPAFVPVIVMLVIVCAESPLVSVMASGALVVPILWVGKIKPEGFRAIPGKGEIFDTNASQFPAALSWKGFTTGKSSEQVWPATKVSHTV